MSDFRNLSLAKFRSSLLPQYDCDFVLMIIVKIFTLKLIFC